MATLLFKGLPFADENNMEMMAKHISAIIDGGSCKDCVRATGKQVESTSHGSFWTIGTRGEWMLKFTSNAIEISRPNYLDEKADRELQALANYLSVKFDATYIDDVSISKINSADDLIVGKYYWCRLKEPYINGEFAEPTVERCDEEEGHKYISRNHWWGPYAVENYDIYGPLEPIVPFQVKTKM